MKNSLLILSLCLLLGCGKTAQETTEPANPASVAQEERPQKPLEAPYFRYLTGKIGDDIQINMHLLVYNDSSLKAYYAYQQVGRAIELEMLSTNRVNGSTELVEYDPDMPLEKEKSGLFNGNFFSKTLIRGTWVNGDGSVVLPFLLNDANPTGAVNIKMEEFSYRAKDCEGKDYCSVIDVIFPQIESEKTDLEQINQVFRSHILSFIYDKKLARNFTSFQELVDSMEVWHQMSDREKSYFSKWNYEVRPSILFNQNEMLSLKFQFFTYEGGPHGLSWDKTFTYNMATGEELSRMHFYPQLSPTQLRDQALKRCKLIYGGSPSSDLRSLGFNISDAEFELSDAFYYSPAGLTFVYSPYQIAPYSRGKVEVFVPF